jgi:putative ABC transport system permease protein
MPTQLRDDLRFALRVSFKRPMLSLVVIATIALGVGATTAVFSIVNALLLRPLAFPHAEQLVQLSSPISEAPRTFVVNYEDVTDLSRENRSFSSLAFYMLYATSVQLGNTEPERVATVQTGTGFGETLQIRPVLGRFFEPNEHLVTGPRAVMISHEFWTTRFHADQSVIGKSILLASQPHTIVGVLPPARSEFPSGDYQLWTPLIIPERSYLRNRYSRQLSTVARLRPSTTLPQASAELTAFARRLARDYPQSNANRTIVATPLRETIVGPVRPMLILLGGAVAAVLLIACANLGSLLLAHSQTRVREFAVRAAIGGAASRITRQLLTETVLLACVGGAAGVWLARQLVAGLVGVYPDRLPRAAEIGLDWRVLLVALGASLLAGLLAAVPVIRQIRRIDLVRDLRDGMRGGGSRSRRRVLNGLVVGQLAASVGLLFGAGVLLRTFIELTTINPGFDAKNTLTFGLAISQFRYPEREREAQFYDALLDSLGTIPGVRSVAWSMFAPLDGNMWGDWFSREGSADVAPNLPLADIHPISSDFPATLHIPLLAGRTLSRSDRAGAPNVALVNAALGAQYYAGTSAVGRRITLDGHRVEIVGVLGDVRDKSLWAAATPAIYVPASQWANPTGVVYVRTDGPPNAIEPQVRAIVRALDPTIPLYDISTLEQRLERSMAPERFRAVLIGTLAALALLLSILGIYGLVAYIVGGRTREIGIRMALGEGTRHVQRRILGDACRLGLVGTSIGVVLSLGAAHWLRAFAIGEVRPRDPWTLVATSLVLLAATIAAAWIPARRASRVDPLVAIRND